MFSSVVPDAGLPDNGSSSRLFLLFIFTMLIKLSFTFTMWIKLEHVSTNVVESQTLVLQALDAKSKRNGHKLHLDLSLNSQMSVI